MSSSARKRKLDFSHNILLPVGICFDARSRTKCWVRWRIADGVVDWDDELAVRMSTTLEISENFQSLEQSRKIGNRKIVEFTYRMYMIQCIVYHAFVRGRRRKRRMWKFVRSQEIVREFQTRISGDSLYQNPSYCVYSWNSAVFRAVRSYSAQKRTLPDVGWINDSLKKQTHSADRIAALLFEKSL